MYETDLPEPTRKKSAYIGAPAHFKLEQACKELNDAFDGQCYLVGSATQGPEWRDVDVRLIMSDEAFAREFPDAGLTSYSHWEFDTKWILLTACISDRLSQLTGLPIDFQFQASSHANKWFPGGRHAIGLRFKKE